MILLHYFQLKNLSKNDEIISSNIHLIFTILCFVLYCKITKTLILGMCFIIIIIILDVNFSQFFHMFASHFSHFFLTKYANKSNITQV